MEGATPDRIETATDTNQRAKAALAGTLISFSQFQPAASKADSGSAGVPYSSIALQKHNPPQDRGSHDAFHRAWV